MGKNILVIEDDLEIQNSLRFALDAEGYSPFFANNGQEGLDVLGSMSDPCVVLLDLMMPVMDGFEFLEIRKLSLALSKVPVVVVSAFLEKAKTLDAQGYVKKPINLDDLFALIEKYCA